MSALRFFQCQQWKHRLGGEPTKRQSLESTKNHGAIRKDRFITTKPVLPKRESKPDKRVTKIMPTNLASKIFSWYGRQHFRWWKHSPPQKKTTNKTADPPSKQRRLRFAKLRWLELMYGIFKVPTLTIKHPLSWIWEPSMLPNNPNIRWSISPDFWLNGDESPWYEETSWKKNPRNQSPNISGTYNGGTH